MALNNSKRRTFHVDWDSPSTETGTVKRRPLSMDISTSNLTCFENTEYYELKDCVGGINLQLVKSIDNSVKLKTSKNKRPSIFNSSKVKKSLSSSIDSTKKIVVESRPIKQVSKLAIKKEFGLKLTKDLELKSKGKLDNCEKTPTGIPKPKINKSMTINKQKKIVNSSSESSGIGSPLSPLSPQNDVNRETISNSASKSSGFGSPDSPDSQLSPDSQQYAALYLIQQQLEKLYNCSCERRQAEVYESLKILIIT